jgi:hypothetical protein
MINLDKTRTKTKWVRNELNSAIINILPKIQLALQKTAIYYDHTKRVSPDELVLQAKNRIDNYISECGYNYSVLSEQKIKDHYSDIKTNDRIDLLVKVSIENDEFIVVIEFDASRADQVAKKFLSRIAQIPNQNLIYIAYCYPGTKKMNLSEVNKYFIYMKNIASKLGLSAFIGMSPPSQDRGDKT